MTETLFMRHRLMMYLYRTCLNAEGTAFILPPTIFGLLVHAENVERIMGMDTLATDTIGDYTVIYAVVPQGTLALCIMAVDSRLAVAEHTIPSESELWLKYLINGLAATTEGVPTEGVVGPLRFGFNGIANATEGTAIEGADLFMLICKGLANSTEGTPIEGVEWILQSGYGIANTTEGTAIERIVPMTMPKGTGYLVANNGIGIEGILPLCIDVGGSANANTYLIGIYPEGAVLINLSDSRGLAEATDGSEAEGIMLLSLYGDGYYAITEGSDTEGVVLLPISVSNGYSAFADGSEAEGIASTEVTPFGRMNVSHIYSTEEDAAGGITYYITSDYHMESDGTVYIGGNYAE